MLARTAALGLALLAPQAALAGPLAPAKASDLVVAVTKDQAATCQGPGGGRPFDTRILPDGSEEPFAIPPKRVLVITSLDWSVSSSAPAGELALPTLVVKNGANSFPVLQGSGFTDPDGSAGGTVIVPNGLTVRSGSTLCIVGAYFFGAFSGIPFTFQARGILHGVPPELFQSLPYVMTIVVLVLVSTAFARRRLGAPAALGRPYVREER